MQEQTALVKGSMIGGRIAQLVRVMTRTGANLILLAEDEPVVRNLLYRVLQREGFEVIPAFDGLDALEVASKTPGINIVLTDLRMPRMDGDHLCVELKRKLPGIKVIIFTGTPHDLASLETSCQPDLILEKPLTGAVICAKLRDVLSQGWGSCA